MTDPTITSEVRILVDADACPVKNILERAAGRHGLSVIMVTATAMKLNERSPAKIERIPGGPDAVDDWILARCGPGDIVVTQDIPLAAAAVGRGARVIEVHGEEMTRQNIADRLSMRNLIMDLREQRVVSGGPRPFSQKDRSRFAQTLGRLLDQMLAGRRGGAL